MNLSLTGRNAIICGSSQGIGFAIAKELAQMGANCILLARNKEKLTISLSQLDTSLQQVHHFFAVDFNDHIALRKLIEEIVKDKPIHILINNSGGPAAGPVLSATEDQFLQAFHQHLLTNHLLTTMVVPTMKEAGFGRVINIISTSVKIPLPNLGVSNTIRGSVASWAKTMANELASFGITVNNVLPGATKTERLSTIILNNAQKKNKNPEEIEKEMIAEIPAKKFGEPEDVAALAAFLCSPSAGYITGVNIPVDGGRTGSI